MRPGVSVIICCYNSAIRLPETLKHLAVQQVPSSIGWEVIVIDNASTDYTAGRAREIWNKFNAPATHLKIIEAPVPGKNYAFEKGLRAAQFDYILTCDDDNWLEDNYITTGFEIMNSDKAIGALGGMGIIEAEQPAKLKIEDLKKIAVNGSQIWASSAHWVYGAGSFYRKHIILSLLNKGWLQVTTGRLGSKLISGEDVEICFMIYLSGYKIIADDCLRFKHFVPVKRQNSAYIINMSYWLSYSNVLLTSYYVLLNEDTKPINQTLNKWYISSAKALLKNVLHLLFQKLKSGQKITGDQKILLRTNYGTFISLVENRNKIQKHHQHVKQLLKDMKTSQEFLTLADAK